MAQATHSKAELSVKKFEPSQNLKTASFVCVAIGVLVFLVGLYRNPTQAWAAYLTAFFFVSCLGLGGLFFVAVNHIAKAGWSSSIRRVAEGMTAFMPYMLVGSLILVAGISYLYPWADKEVLANSALISAKTAYLNKGFFIARMLIFGLGMMFFAHKMVGNSLKQDQSGDESLTHSNLTWGISFTPFFAIFFSLFSVDLLMSLMPTWYSTIFGIYCFAGSFQSSLAFLAILLIYLKRSGNVSGYINDEHIHDVGKFLKAFTVFWAYIAFSQFMLIWYANIPEETEYYILRSQGGWMPISLGLLIFKFIVPFLALLPRGAKRNHNHLIAVSVLVLIMQYVDVYWLVYPNFNENQVTFGFYEIGLLVGFVGLFLIALTKFFTKNSLVAIKDPRMHEALNHHVTY